MARLNDWLPADLEFLGCQGDPDNTTNAPTNPGSSDEYPGPARSWSVPSPIATSRPWSKRSWPTRTVPARCPKPFTPTSSGTPATSPRPGDHLPLPRRGAAGREHPNWSGATRRPPGPRCEPGQQRDRPAEGRSRTKQKIVNYAIASGDYQAMGYSFSVFDDTTLQRTAEDLVVYKSNLTSSTLAQGDVNT